MKKLLHIVSIGVIVIALIQLVNVYTRPALGQPQDLATPFANLPQGTPQTVFFDVDEATFTSLTERQQNDQFRDWLLLSVLTDAGLSVEELNQITFDLAPVRHDFLSSVTSFEYGETRSRVIGNDQIVALVPANQQPAARQDALAHIADPRYRGPR